MFVVAGISGTIPTHRRRSSNPKEILMSRPRNVESANRTRLPVAVMAAITLASPAMAEKIKVDPDDGDTIQAAVDLALTNVDDTDVIVVKPGVYTEVVTIDYTGTTQTGLTIRAAGKDNTFEIASSGGAAVIIRAATDVRLSDATLSSSDALDGIPALLIDTGSKDVTCRDVNGVPGDDLGVVVLGSDTSGCLFESCDFSGMGGAAFVLDGVGHMVRDATMNDCGLNALLLTDLSLLCAIEDCEAISSGGANATEPGVITIRGNGHRVTGTDVGGGGDHGVWVTGEGHIIRDTTSNGNVGAGFFLSDATGIFEDCVAKENEFGVEGGGLSAHIVGGKFIDNLSHGLNIATGGVLVRDVKAKKNGGDGIHVMAAAAGTLISGCKVVDNTGEGIVVAGDLAWVEGNVSKGGDSFLDSGQDNAGRDNVLKDGGTNDF